MFHKDLDAWKLSLVLVTHIYDETANFPKEERYGLSQQMRRSAVSIPSNIAEGCSRKSNKETIQFLYYSLASASELETQLIIAENIGFMSSEKFLEELYIIRKTITGLLKYLKTKTEN